MKVIIKLQGSDDGPLSGGSNCIASNVGLGGARYIQKHNYYETVSNAFCHYRIAIKIRTMLIRSHPLS